MLQILGAIVLAIVAKALLHASDRTIAQ